jgi:hypothetical protein
MNSITNLFQQAQLAEAAYADFSAPGVSTIDALKDKNNGGGFSIAQADAFTAQWEVVDQYTATGLFGLTDGTGFSGTVFKNKATGQYTFSLRGTAGPTDLMADAGDVLADGIALDQTVDMYNYWQRLTHLGVYQAAVLETQVAETAKLRWVQLSMPTMSLNYRQRAW